MRQKIVVKISTIHISFFFLFRLPCFLQRRLPISFCRSKVPTISLSWVAIHLSPPHFLHFKCLNLLQRSQNTVPCKCKLTVPRNSNFETRSSELESFEYRGSSQVHQVSSRVHRVLRQGNKELFAWLVFHTSYPRPQFQPCRDSQLRVFAFCWSDVRTCMLEQICNATQDVNIRWFSKSALRQANGHVEVSPVPCRILP